MPKRGGGNAPTGPQAGGREPRDPGLPSSPAAMGAMAGYQPINLDTAPRRAVSSTAASPWVIGMVTLRTDLSAFS